MSIKSNLEEFKSLSEKVTLVAVSKTKPKEDILEAYHAGQRVFGENKVQEMADKYDHLPKDIQWHMIGHLQRNKVKYIAPFVNLIHSIDSERLLAEVNKQALKNDRKIPVLLQVHIAEEETKFGWDDTELLNFFGANLFENYKGITFSGVMGMATFTENEAHIKREFGHLRSIFETINTRYGSLLPEFNQISMGMSGDFKIAIEEGSTMIRVGSAIFGERNYHKS